MVFFPELPCSLNTRMYIREHCHIGVVAHGHPFLQVGISSPVLEVRFAAQKEGLMTWWRLDLAKAAF